MNSITKPVEVTVIRKSINTNSFGLRGYWCIENKPDDLGFHRVFSFATSDDLEKGVQKIRFHTDAEGKAHHPAFELPERKGTLPKESFQKFVSTFLSQTQGA